MNKSDIDILVKTLKIVLSNEAAGVNAIVSVCSGKDFFTFKICGENRDCVCVTKETDGHTLVQYWKLSIGEKNDEETAI